MYVCMYVHVHVHIHIHIHIHILILILMHMHMHIHIHIHIHIHAHIGTAGANDGELSVHMHECIYVCMYVHMHACMHACMHGCMYVCLSESKTTNPKLENPRTKAPPVESCARQGVQSCQDSFGAPLFKVEGFMRLRPLCSLWIPVPRPTKGARRFSRPESSCPKNMRCDVM